MVITRLAILNIQARPNPAFNHRSKLRLKFENTTHNTIRSFAVLDLNLNLNLPFQARGLTFRITAGGESRPALKNISYYNILKTTCVVFTLSIEIAPSDKHSFCYGTAIGLYYFSR